MIWSEFLYIQLVFDAKDRGTFFSATWRREYCPELSLISRNCKSQPSKVTQKALYELPHGQHYLLSFTTFPVIGLFPIRRGNFRNETAYAENLEKMWNEFHRLVRTTRD